MTISKSAGQKQDRPDEDQPVLDSEISAYGVIERHTNTDEIDEIVEELYNLGCTTFQSGLTPAELDGLREGLGPVYQRQCEEMAPIRPLERSNDSDVVRCPLAYDPAFLKLALNPMLIRVCTRIFGESFVLLQQNGLINHPVRKHYQLKWHRDLAFQHWVSSRPVAVAILLCLDDFSPVTGGTYLLPGSHRSEQFPSERFITKHQQVTVAPAGTMLLMDAMIFHRAGKNTSSGVRRAVNHLVGRPFLSQQIDIPLLLGDGHASDPFRAKYLGYQWRPASSVAAWRSQR